MSEYGENIWIEGAQDASMGILGLASSVGNYKDQRDYNKTQREIAAETNAANERINQRNLDWEREKLALEQEYASALTKRSQLESAGINPYSMYGQQLGNPQGGTPQSHPMLSPNQVVQDGFSKGLQELNRNTIQAIGTIAQAKKDDAEARSQQIQNMFLGSRMAGELERQGIGNEQAWTDLRQSVEMNPRIQDNLDALTVKYDEESALLRVQAGLARYDLNFLKPQEYNKVLEETNLLFQKQLTEMEYREHMRRMDRNGALSAAADWVIAQVHDYMKYNQNEFYGSQAERNRAEAGVLSQEYISKDIENGIKKVMAKPMAMAEFRNLVRQGGYTRALTQSEFLKTKHLQQVIDWNTYNEIMQGLGTLTSGAGNAVLFKFLLGM